LGGGGGGGGGGWGAPLPPPPPLLLVFEASPTQGVRISGEGLNHGTQLNFDDAGVRRLGAGQQDDFCHVLRVKHP
jgi:hypothetical protein